MTSVVLMVSRCPHCQGGIYVFQLLDYYGCNGACLLCVAIAECIAVGWAFGMFNLGSRAKLLQLVWIITIIIYI